MRVSWRTEWPHWLLLLAAGLIAAVVWPVAPAQLPLHWNAFGEIDRYGNRLEGVLLLPALALGVYLLLLVLPRLDPGRANYAQFAGAYAAIRFAALALLILYYGWPLVSLVDGAGEPATPPVALLGIFLVVIGNFLGKLRPNWFVGIRTPWTLSSKRAWSKTHRLGGWLCIAVGAVVLVVGVPQPAWATLALPVLGGGLVAWALVYSYLVWRADPDKVPVAGTLPAGET